MGILPGTNTDGLNGKYQIVARRPLLSTLSCGDKPYYASAQWRSDKAVTAFSALERRHWRGGGTRLSTSCGIKDRKIKYFFRELRIFFYAESYFGMIDVRTHFWYFFLGCFRGSIVIGSHF